MSRMFTLSVRALLVGVGMAIISSVSLAAGNPVSATPPAEEQHEQSWYREQQQTGKPDPKAIVQQKAQFRAEQRMSRMASMEWYGMSNSRPQACPTPLTSRYSPTWENPGGSPYSWFPYSRPGYVLYWH
jgi:hypothetical protein